MHALEKWGSIPKIPDAVVIIRGGGAVNDLAWLNDYDLARCICDLAIPVFTGIGHERDSTVLDEVTHTKFDTPSKVIAGIEKVIRMRAQEAKEHFEEIAKMAGPCCNDRAADGGALRCRNQKQCRSSGGPGAATVGGADGPTATGSGPDSARCG